MATHLQSACPAPFLDVVNYPYTGGQLQSRFCAPIDRNTTCCLPCPATDWVYPDNFDTVTNAANWVSMCSFACCMILLVSFAVLPVRKTSRHYLTVCLVAAVGLLTFAFVVPLGAHPNQCYDAITPNNMISDHACALSGSFVLFGGMAGAVWVLIRSLSLHLQICWQIVPGKKFFYSSLLAGWGIPSILLALSLSLSGVSYRFGSVCHINHDYSLGTFWGPILGFTGLAAASQFITLGYCIRVYLRSLMDSGATSATSSTAASSTLPSAHGSFKIVSARAAYRRVRKVIALQWRGVMVVIILIVSAAYFSVVFLKLDSATVATQNDPQAALPWLECLYLSGGDKNQCLGQASSLILGEPTVATVLYLIAVMGFWCVLFLGRLSMVGAWWEFISRPFRSDTDTWISADARRMSDPRNYEMLTGPPQQYFIAKGPSGLIATTEGVPADTVRPLSPLQPNKEIYSGSIVRDFSPSIPETYTGADTRSYVQRLASREHSYQKPYRSASQNTARVTFNAETPTTIISASAMSPRSPSSSEFFTPQTFASPTGPSAGGHDYFSRSNSNWRKEREQERSGSALSGRRERTGSALGRDWYGQETGEPAPTVHSQDRQHRNYGPLQEWEPQSTFARSGSFR